MSKRIEQATGEHQREPVQLLCFQVGERVRALRREHSMTRRELAKATNISERYLGQLENGQANASLQILHRIACEFDRSISSVLPSDAQLTVGYQPLAELLSRLGDAEQEEAFCLLSKKFDNGKSSLKGIALLGLRGAGKTTLGSQLAELAGVRFVRLTQVVTDRVGLSMPEIMELWGPGAFRRYEREALSSIIDEPGMIVLEASGGVVGDEASLELLNQRFHTVWLKATADEHMQRVIDQNDLRPMSGRREAMKDLVGILGERERAYANADSTLDTSGRNVRDCLSELVQLGKPVLCR